MGLTALPTSGIVYIDAQILIYSVEGHARLAEVLLPLWRAADAAELVLVTSSLSVMETSILPLRNNNQQHLEGFKAAFAHPQLRVAEITHKILHEAAVARARLLPLRTPDAIHLATARLTKCTTFVTNDTQLAKMIELPVCLLSDAAK